MDTQKLNQLQSFVEDEISVFLDKRLEKLSLITLDIVLQKNMYLFRSLNPKTSEELLKMSIDAFISSSEETMFGNLLERIAIETSKLNDNGVKSAIKGIDIEFTRRGVRYFVVVKSGPNWGNADQKAQMDAHIKSVNRTLSTSGASFTSKEFINGCCYGQEANENKGNYFKKCGQSFWEFLSQRNSLYLDLIIPIQKIAIQKDSQYLSNYSSKLNSLVSDFSNSYLTTSGQIDWIKLVEFNSSK